MFSMSFFRLPKAYRNDLTNVGFPNVNRGMPIFQSRHTNRAFLQITKLPTPKFNTSKSAIFPMKREILDF